MIYTLTLNPSLDYLITVPNFQMGRTNRTTTESIIPGGKGLNVSKVLSNLGVESTAFGFVAGFTGEEIRRRTKEYGIHAEYISVSKGVSRINIKLLSVDGTEINGQGPQIGEVEQKMLLDKIRCLKEGDSFVLAGSIPDSLPQDIYSQIMESLKGKGVQFVVDTTQEGLVAAIKQNPFLVKPNHHELGELFHTTISSKEMAITYAKQLQEMGAKNVLVSMSAQGAVFLSEKGDVIKKDAPKGEVVNAVGAGDSMVAGFLAGWQEKQDYEYAFYTALAAGSASAFSKELATKEEIKKLRASLV